MRQLYAMRGANGDWFAMDQNGHLHVPVFRNRSAALCARARHSGMRLLRPAVLDAQALQDLATADQTCAVRFWLVDNPSADPSRGYPLELAQLVLSVQDTIEL